MQPNAHKDLREIWLAPDRATAETAIATFAENTHQNTTRPSNA